MAFSTMEVRERSQVQAPEGLYECVDWANPVLNRSAKQHGGNAVSTGQSNARAQLATPRQLGLIDPARLSAVPFRTPNAPFRPDPALHGKPLDPTLISQGLDAHPDSYMERAPDEAGTSPVQSPNLGRRNARPNRPKTALKGTSSVFVTRAQTFTDLGKLLQNRSEAVTITLVTSSRSVFWYANIGPCIREPLARITFSNVPTCHDINQSTAFPDRLDVVMGFAQGDILWVDPVTMRYARINKGGAISKSPLTQIRWMPRSENLFLSAHEDGTLLLWDRDQEDAPSDAHMPRPDANWDFDQHMFVARPPDANVEGAAGGGWLSRPKEQSLATLNPVRIWHVARRSVSDIAFSPDGVHVAVTSIDGVLRLVVLQSEQLQRSFASYFGGFLCVAWSPDGQYIVTGGQDDLLTVWSPAHGRLLARAQGHHSYVTALAFDPWYADVDPDVHRVVSVGEDTYVAFWDIRRSRLPLQGAQVPYGVHCPASPRAGVLMLQPAAMAIVPGAILSSVRVTPHGILLLHCDGQMDWFARPNEELPPAASKPKSGWLSLGRS